MRFTACGLIRRPHGLYLRFLLLFFLFSFVDINNKCHDKIKVYGRILQFRDQNKPPPPMAYSHFPAGKLSLQLPLDPSATCRLLIGHPPDLSPRSNQKRGHLHGLSRGVWQGGGGGGWGLGDGGRREHCYLFWFDSVWLYAFLVSFGFPLYVSTPCYNNLASQSVSAPREEARTRNPVHTYLRTRGQTQPAGSVSLSGTPTLLVAS